MSRVGASPGWEPPIGRDDSGVAPRVEAEAHIHAAPIVAHAAVAARI
jgi:hypothetical protein